MRHRRAILIATSLGLGLGGCAVTAEDGELGVTTQALIGQDTYLYFRCNATGWDVNAATRLTATADPYLFSLVFDVDEPWMVTNGDSCVFTETNQLDGWGTVQTQYGSRDSQPIAVPGGGWLATGSSVPLRYPELGRYEVTVNWRQGTFTVEGFDAATAWEPPLDAEISAIDQNPQVPGYVHVGCANGDLYRAFDGAASKPAWSKIDDWTDASGGTHSLPNSQVTAIASNPRNFRQTFVAFAGTHMGPKLFETGNGYTWSQVTSIPIGEIWGLSFNPVDSAFVYAYGLGGVAASNDYGQTWTGSVGDPLQPPMAAGSAITAAAVMNDLDNVWVGTTAGELFMTFNASGAQTWTRLDTEAMPKRPILRITKGAAGMQPPEVYVTFAGVLDDSVWVTRNGGQAWLDLHDAPLPTTAVVVGALGMLGVSVNPQDSDVLYLGFTYDTFLSTDRGATWR